MTTTKQAFLLNDGARFRFMGEEYKLISQDEYYDGEIEDTKGQRHNFNTCATVELIEDGPDNPVVNPSNN